MNLRALMHALLDISIAALLTVALVWAINTFLSLPDVYKSHRTNECVKVIYADGSSGFCDELPPRYNLIWVE